MPTEHHCPAKWQKIDWNNSRAILNDTCRWVICGAIPGFVSVKPWEYSWRFLGVGGGRRDWKGQQKGHVLTGQHAQ